jgi:CubicO group peptidase (beta-lactamase class C family)
MKFKLLTIVFAIAVYLYGTVTKAQDVSEVKVKQVSATKAASLINSLKDELLDVLSKSSREEAIRFTLERLDETMIEQSSEEAVINHILKISEQSGGFEVLETKSFNPNEVKLLVRARKSSELAQLTATLSKASNEKLRSFRLELLPSAAEKRVKEWAKLKMSESEAVLEIRQNIQDLAAIDKFSGVLLVARGNKILLHRAFGKMSQSSQKPNRKNTLFPTASMSKMFTAIAIAQLVEQGKLSLDDTLDKVLPNYPDKTAAKKIKIWHLLSHQSGLGNFFNDEYKRNPERYNRPSDYFPLFANKPLFFEPGTKWVYSNAGMVVLGAVVEHVSKQRFEDYLRENIFAPAGMKSTFYNPADAPKNRIASLHSRFESNDPLENDPRKEHSNHRSASPAGNTFTTTEDMMRFIQALQTGNLIKRETLIKFTTPNELTPRSEQYVYGFETFEHNVKTGYGHSGGAPGVNSNTITFADGSYTIVILSNYDPGLAQNFARNAARLLANVPIFSSK